MIGVQGFGFPVEMGGCIRHYIIEGQTSSYARWMITMIQQFDLPARWKSFLQEYYSEDIHALMVRWPDLRSLEVSYGSLQEYDPEFSGFTLDHPEAFHDAGNRALREYIAEMGEAMNPRIRITNLPIDFRREVRHIRHEDVGLLLSVDAIVSKISSVRPRIYEAQFRCSMCGHTTVVNQPNEQELHEPFECSEIDGGCNRNRRQTRFTILPESPMIDHQYIELQEPPERLRGGLQPERILTIAEDDLVGRVTPGDRVIVNGELFTRSQRKGGKDTPIYDIFMKVFSIEFNDVSYDLEDISTKDEEQIKEISKRPDLYELFKRSIAPSIYGFPHIKESLTLQLFGGVSRILPDGNRNRGDIHLLLAGDPGVAKSQFLNYMAELSPRGNFTSGLSASAAGLTAAAVQDSTMDGRWTLEAGALVLSDRGLAAVDEFDKMNDNDRSSMHEAMEQQRISVAKAGINARLSTRCSVLAAANPKSGRFLNPAIDNIPYTRQIDLSPPLLSRFDLIWVITDTPTGEEDLRIAAHIIENRQSGISETKIETGGHRNPSKITNEDGMQSDHDEEDILGYEIFRKYIAYAKRNIDPKLNMEAREMISAFYVKERTGDGIDPEKIRMTARSIEALVRLSEASARIRLSEDADETDAGRAIRLFKTWRFLLMGTDFDETTLQSGIVAPVRNATNSIRRFITDRYQETQTAVPTHEILSHLESIGVKVEQEKVEGILEQLRLQGDIMMPSGYGTYTPV